MNYPVVYLSKSDFDRYGNISNRMLLDKRIVIMIQANFCGHCTVAKPAFEEAAKLMQRYPDIVFATIEGDGDGKDIMPMIERIHPGFVGFPDYVLYDNGKRVNTRGPRGRTTQDLLRWLNR